MKAYAVGVDVGGTSVKLGLFSLEGALLDKWEIPTRTEGKGGKILPDVVRSIEEKLAEKGVSPQEVEGVGIGVPGPVDGDSTVRKCVNLGWDVFDLKARMNELLPAIPNVAAGNDANVAALGELWQGSAKGAQSFVMVALGTGVGGGVVAGGQLVSGAFGAGGEIGHITVNRDETLSCGCGRKGCLEQYSSATGVVRLYKLECVNHGTEPVHLDGPTDTLSVFNACRAGDEAAKAAIATMAEYLGYAFAQISLITDPQMYLLGGGVSGGFDLFADDLRAAFRKYCLAPCAGARILPASLGNDAAMYGSAFKAMQG